MTSLTSIPMVQPLNGLDRAVVGQSSPAQSAKQSD